MRDGWRETTLGELASWASGTYLAKKDRSGGPIPVVGANGEIGRTASATHHTDVITVGRVGACGAVHRTNGPTWITDNALVATPRAGVSLGYLYLALQHTNFSPLISGTNQPLITQTRVKRVSTLLPPPAEQGRIVDLIGVVDDAIEAAERSLWRAQELTMARLRAIVRGTEETIAFDEVATFASGAAFPTNAQGAADGDIPFIKVSDMNLPGNETRILTANNYVTADGLRRLKARAWPAGTVVFPKVGAALLTEKRRLLTEPTAFDNNVMGVIPREGVITSSFLFSFMRTVRLGDYAQIGAVPSINQSHLRALSVPALSLEQQHEFDAEIAALDAASAANRTVADRLRELRSNLLTSLLSGEHEIPGSYDELLEATA